MLRVFLVSLLLLLIVNLFKYLKPEYAYLFRILSVCAVFVPLIAAFEGLSESLLSLADTGNVDFQLVKTALKISALTLCTQITADMCRDCHEAALATVIEITGRVTVLTVSFPIIMKLIQFGEGIIK